MSKISGIPEILALLQQQAERSSLASSIKGKGVTQLGSLGSHDGESISLGQAVENVYLRVRNENIPAREKLKRLIRTVLSWEFGDNILDDSQCIDLIEKILVQVEESTQLSAQIDHLFHMNENP